MLAEEMANQANTIHRKIESDSEDVSGVIKLTVSEVCAKRFVLPVIRDFKRDYPDVDFKLIAAEEVLNLAGRKADIAIHAVPNALADDEVNRLLNAFPLERPSCRRGYAMVRCALDLGMRAGEIAKLALANIDWPTNIRGLLIGTGSGLAPLYGIIRDALSQGHTGPSICFTAAAT